MSAGAVSAPMIIPLKNTLEGPYKKNVVYSDCPIEVYCETPHAVIYVTHDGSKPEPFEKSTASSRSTILYEKPFFLHPGRRVIKAVAISFDGAKCSNVVTKIFEVLARVEDASPVIVMGAGMQLIDRVVNIPRSLTEGGPFKTESGLVPQAYGSTDDKHNGQRIWSADVENVPAQTAPVSFETQEHHSTSSGLPSASSHSSKVWPRLVCSCGQLFDERKPGNFCDSCGVQRVSFPESKVDLPAFCPRCRSTRRIDSDVCQNCHLVFILGDRPIVSKQFKRCRRCASLNMSDALSCLVCREFLPRIALRHQNGSAAQAARPLPMSQANRFKVCSACTRVNDGSARFCDWCGSSPEDFHNANICVNCGDSTRPHGDYCASCGALIPPPPQYLFSKFWHDFQLKENLEPFMIERSGLSYLPAVWLGITFPEMEAKLYDNKSIQVPLEPCGSQAASTATLSPPLQILETPRSLGRPSCAHQVDHISRSLLLYADNDHMFGATVERLHLGRIVTASVKGSTPSTTVQFDLIFTLQPSLEVDTQLMGETSSTTNSRTDTPTTLPSISVSSSVSDRSGATNGAPGSGSTVGSFVRPPRTRRQTAAGLPTSDPSVIAESPMSTAASLQLGHLPADPVFGDLDPKLTVAVESDKLGKRCVPSASDQLNHRRDSDHLRYSAELLSILKSESWVDEREVRSLLSRGASANGLPDQPSPLVLSVCLERPDLTRLLLESGATVNSPSPGPDGNTALHEAASKNSRHAVDILGLLIAAGGDLHSKNYHQQTALDIAYANDNQFAVEVLVQIDSRRG